MKAITLNEVILDESQNPDFVKHFQREVMINEIAKLVVQLRKKARLTQQELAERAGTTQPVIACLESGSDQRVPSLTLLTRMAAAANANLKIVLISDDCS